MATAKEGDESLGIAALQFVAGDPRLFQRFLDLSGLDVSQLRSAAADPAFFAGLLDFILAHEPTLIAFAAEAGVPPGDVAAARRRIGKVYGAEEA